MSDVTRALRDLHSKAGDLEGERSGLEITAAELWCQVLDGKTYKDEGCKSVDEYIHLVGADITRQYVYNLADVWRCAPLREVYTTIGPQKSVIIAKAYKQDKISYDDAEVVAYKAADETWTVKEVKDAVKTLTEINQETDEQDTVGALLDRQAELIKKRTKLEQQLEDVNQEIKDVQDRLEKLAD